MMPVFIILNSSLDVLPEIDAYVNSGYESMLYSEFLWEFEIQDDGTWKVIGDKAKQILNASSVLFLCWKDFQNITSIVYK